MVKITTKTDLNQGTEMDVDTSSKTIRLIVAGNMTSGSTGGVTGQALYSAIYDLFISDAGYQGFQFPLALVDGPTATQMELREGWEFFDLTSVGLLRDSGFAYKDLTDTITLEYGCYVQAGDLVSPTDQPYYIRTAETVPTDFGFPNEFNECIQIFGDVTHGNFDKRSKVCIFIREQGNTYAQYDLVTEQELSSITYRKYLIPVTTEIDNDINVSDSTIDSTAPYTGMTLTWIDGIGFTAWINSTVYPANSVVSDLGNWYITTAGGTSNGTGVADDIGVTWVSYSGERSVDGVFYAFNIIMDGNSGIKAENYNWIQRQLRKTTDIDSGANTHRGDIEEDAFLTFLGDILVTSTGLYVDNHLTSEQSDYIFTDVGGVERSIPFLPQITINSVDSNGSSVDYTTGTRIQIYNSSGVSASSWQTTSYIVGNKVLRTSGAGTESGSGLWFECTTAGTSSGSEPTWDTTVGNTTSDGTVIWTTRAIEMYNNQPGAVNNVSISYESGANESANIRVRVIAVNGTVNSEKWQQTTLTASTDNVSVSVTQESNAIYVDNNVDGSTVTEASISSGGIDINVNDSDNSTTFQRIYNWYQYYLSTESGIRDSSDLIIAETQTSYIFDNEIEIKNTKTGSPLTIQGANAVDEDNDPIGIFDLTGESIFTNNTTVVPFSFSSGSGLSGEEHGWLSSVNDVTALNLDEQTSKALQLDDFVALN